MFPTPKVPRFAEVPRREVFGCAAKDILQRSVLTRVGDLPESSFGGGSRDVMVEAYVDLGRARSIGGHARLCFRTGTMNDTHKAPPRPAQR